MSEQAKYTPGPWEVVGLSGVCGPYAIRMAYDNPAANKTYYGVQAIGTKANATLIAATPDLLHALRTLVDRDLQYDGNRIVIECASHSDAMSKIRSARAVVAKALGRPQAVAISEPVKPAA